MPEEQVKDKPVESVVEVTSTPPVTVPIKKKGISPWIFVLIVALILIPCILCFVIMVLPLILATASGVTQYTTTSSSMSYLDDYYGATSSADSLASSSATSSVEDTSDGSIGVDPYSSSNSSRASSTTSVASTSSSSVASTTTSSSTSSVRFDITSLGISADKTNPGHNLQCSESVDFHFTGNITANSAGTFYYYWYRQDTGRYDVETLTFTSAGTKQVFKTVNVTANAVNVSPSHYSGYFEVQIFENVENPFIKSNVIPVTYTVACVP